MFALKQVTLNGSQRPRLADLTLTIPHGRTAVVGLSGAGKTSLLHVLADFEKPDQGTVTRSVEPSTAARRDGANDPKDVIRERLPLFWVPQNGGLWPHLTAEEHLKAVAPDDGSGKTVRKLRKNEVSLNLADEMLAAMDLRKRRSALPGELSQGERSRLSLARALASKARVLLMDEPLSHVDAVRKPAFWETAGRFLSEDSISVVFSSHDPETVLRQSDGVICLDEGRLLFQGATRTLYDSPPDRRLGEFVGPLNWFDDAAASLFLSVADRKPEGTGIRPEHLIMLAEPSSSVEYVGLGFCGSYLESEVRHKPSGALFTAKHQMTQELPVPGQNIAFRVLRGPQSVT